MSRDLRFSQHVEEDQSLLGYHTVSVRKLKIKSPILVPSLFRRFCGMKRHVIVSQKSLFFSNCFIGPITVSKAWIFRPSLAEIVGLNPAGGMDVSLLWTLCVVR
jgi:hypothetical protein